MQQQNSPDSQAFAPQHTTPVAAQAPTAPPENTMGTMPMNRLLFRLSIPMIISMLVQALYNVVDSIFISRVSEEALTAVSLAFSVQNIMIAVGVGTGIGVNALVSRSLGEKNHAQAQRIAGNGIFLTLCSSAVMMLFAVFFVGPYFSMQTNDAEIIREGVNYLFLCCLFSQGLFVQLIMEKLLAATGKTNHSMISQLSGAVVNIILDPIFIFGYCGEALSGARGAAVATVIGQAVAALVGFYFCQYKGSPLKLSLAGLRPHMPTIRRIYSIGAPSIAMISVSSVMLLGLNQILMAFSATAVAVFGIYYRLQSFVFMPVFGVNNATMPLIGYNFGAQVPNRIVQCIGYAFLYVQVIRLVGVGVFYAMPDTLLCVFEASDAMLAIGVPALRIIGLSFLFAGINMVCATVFQSLSYSIYSFYLSILRQIILLLPIAYLLGFTGNLELVWWAFPISEGGCLLLAFAVLVRVNKKVLRPMQQRAQG